MPIKQWLSIVLLFLFLQGLSNAQKVEDPDPQRFQQEIDAFAQWDAKNSFPREAILFVGSSSIRFWKSHKAFPDYPVINRGFGGAHISDVQYFYEQVIGKYDPSVIVFYAGDNDIAAGKPVEQVVGDYKELTDRIVQQFSDLKLIYVPIKPSSSRWQFWPEMEQANRQIKTYSKQNSHLYYVDLATPVLNSEGKPNDALFRDDHLHLNEQGYAIWNRLLRPELEKLYDQ